MNSVLRKLVDELYPDQSLRRNPAVETAELLSFMVRVSGAARVVEIGTGNGSSAIWLADAVRATGGHLTSVDAADPTEAVVNLARAGLGNLVTFEVADGGEYLRRLPDESVDLLFLDAERTRYPDWWPEPRRVLRPGGILAVGNERPGAVTPITEDPQLEVVGSGLLLARRTP
ncbi:MAG TPA: class I SAM-dependent methyltransferase [Actinoplanes sp.]|nr:class I SAM-dependent methyltransferase [Actinoplanes sp.]